MKSIDIFSVSLDVLKNTSSISVPIGVHDVSGFWLWLKTVCPESDYLLDVHCIIKHTMTHNNSKQHEAWEDVLSCKHKDCMMIHHTCSLSNKQTNTHHMLFEDRADKRSDPTLAFAGIWTWPSTTSLTCVMWQVKIRLEWSHSSSL